MILRAKLEVLTGADRSGRFQTEILHCQAGSATRAISCVNPAHPAETTEAFLDGHVSAFAFFGEVPQSILYDNTKLAVARIVGDGQRIRTRESAKRRISQ